MSGFSIAIKFTRSYETSVVLLLQIREQAAADGEASFTLSLKGAGAGHTARAQIVAAMQRTRACAAAAATDAAPTDAAAAAAAAPDRAPAAEPSASEATPARRPARGGRNLQGAKVGRVLAQHHVAALGEERAQQFERLRDAGRREERLRPDAVAVVAREQGGETAAVWPREVDRIVGRVAHVAILQRLRRDERPRVLDAFCGGGGSSEGVRRAGGASPSCPRWRGSHFCRSTTRQRSCASPDPGSPPATWATSSSGSSSTLVSDLRDLLRWHEGGLLSDAEFQRAKSLLGLS